MALKTIYSTRMVYRKEIEIAYISKILRSSRKWLRKQKDDDMEFQSVLVYKKYGADRISIAHSDELEQHQPTHCTPPPLYFIYKGKLQRTGHNYCTLIGGSGAVAVCQQYRVLVYGVCTKDNSRYIAKDI